MEKNYIDYMETCINSIDFKVPVDYIPGQPMLWAAYDRGNPCKCRDRRPSRFMLIMKHNDTDYIRYYELVGPKSSLLKTFTFKKIFFGVMTFIIAENSDSLEFYRVADPAKLDAIRNWIDANSDFTIHRNELSSMGLRQYLAENEISGPYPVNYKPSRFAIRLP